MTNDIATSMLSSNYAPANYRSADVFGGNYPINTPSGIFFDPIISYLISNLVVTRN